MSFAVPADQPSGIFNDFVLDSCTARKFGLTLGWWMWVILILGLIKERSLCKFTKNKMAVTQCDLLFMKRFCLLSWQIYLPWHLFCLLKKNSYSSVRSLGMINTFCVPSPITLSLFSIPAWGRKYISDLFFPTLLIASSCDFYAFHTFRYFTCTSRTYTYYLFIYLFYWFYFWLLWIFIAVRRLSVVAVSSGYSSLRCKDVSLWWLLLLWSTSSRHGGFSSCGSQALEHRLSSCGTRA